MAASSPPRRSSKRPSPTTRTSTCARRPTWTTCASARVATSAPPALDNLERALQAAEADPDRSAAPTQGAGFGDHAMTKGIRLVQAEFVGALTRAGIAIEDPMGWPFDPHRHEALAQAPVEGTPAGVVVEVYQPGYVLGDAVLRPARVVVSG